MADPTTQRTFYYHADASAVGGYINRPFNGFIPSHTSLSLPVVGGFVQKERKRSRPWKDIINFSSESTHVSGSKQGEENGGPWTTQVSATVEDLNILDVVTAKKIVAQLSVAHPHDGGEPTISIVGTQFVDLRISNHPIDAMIRYDLFSDHDGEPTTDQGKKDRSVYPNSPWPKQNSLLTKVDQQLRQAQKLYTEKYNEAQTPDWFSHRLRWLSTSEGQEDRDHVVCSLIDHLSGLPANFPGIVCGNSIYIQGFGKFSFGEVIIHRRLFRVSMVHAELGSAVGGAASFAVASSNGHPGGP